MNRAGIGRSGWRNGARGRAVEQAEREVQRIGSADDLSSAVGSGRCGAPEIGDVRAGVGSDIRQQADDVLEYIIAPALKEMEIEAVRGDHFSEPGLITNQVVEAILTHDFCIADLSGMYFMN